MKKKSFLITLVLCLVLVFIPDLIQAEQVQETDVASLVKEAAAYMDAGEEVPEEAETPQTVGMTDADSITGNTSTHEITTASFNLLIGTTDIGLPIPLYFLDGADDLPYLEMDDVLTLILLTLSSTTGAYTFTINTEDPVVTITRVNPTEGALDNGVYAAFDFEKDTIEFSDHDLFCWKAESNTVLDITSISTYNAEGEPSVLQKVEKNSLDRYGTELVVRAGDYGIDLIEQDGKYLVPMQTIVDFIMWPARGQGLFFNGQALIYTTQITAGVDEVYYAAPTGERSTALAEYGYNELCMMLDYLYGLKEAHGIDSFDSLFHTVYFDDLLKEPSAVSADLAISLLTMDYFDDGHSGFLTSSYLAGSVDYDVPYGISVSVMRDEGERYEEAREKYYPDGIPGYEEIGNTAYVTFDSFDIPDTNFERYYEVEDVNEFDDTDTIGLIMKAHAQITRENSPIENVVLDLSCNGGGASDTAVFTLAWLLGEASVGVENTMTGAMCSANYRADVNRDRKFDDNDTVKDKNIFCLISPNSFSCGNLVPCVLKESNKVTLLGRTSGGGSCVVQFASSAWGSSFRISGPKRLSFLKNGSFYDIDRGADPDYLLSKPEKYYDRASLTDYINSLY